MAVTGVSVISVPVSDPCGRRKDPALKVSFERELTSTAVPSRNERRAASYAPAPGR